jgi:hypothetical protein
MFECNKCGIHQACKVIYEEADDGAYYLNFALTDHVAGGGCLKPKATVAEKRAAGDLWIPEGYLEMARKFGAGLPTSVVHQMLSSAAAIDNLDITWNWHHLNWALGKGERGASDAGGLTQWLCHRNLTEVGRCRLTPG